MFGGGGATFANNTNCGAGGGRSAIQITLTATISTATGSGTTVTYTTNSAHGLVAGQPVIITGLTPSGYNGTFAVVNIISSTQFTVTNTTTGTSSGTGTIVAELVTVGGGGGSADYTATGGNATYSGTAVSGGIGIGGTAVAATGGSQTAGGTAASGGANQSGAAGIIIKGGNAGYRGGGGGGGYYGGGGGGSDNGGGANYAGGGGGSSWTGYSGFTLTSGSNSTDGYTAPGTGTSGYISGVATGGTTGGGAGGAGLILLASIGNAFAESMRIGSNGYVGVATASPATTLDVAGTTRTTVLSSVTVNTTNIQTSNILIGTVSSQSYLAFPGLQQGYTQSVLAEVSTGTGLQEMLLFRGSTATDRIRMQTTGSIIFETGVGARVFPAAPSNVTPAMIINTSSNVGIGIAAPTVTLDVAGAGRFQTLSSQQIYASSFVGGVVSVATVYATTVSSLAGFFSTVNNYQIGGALYLPTQIFTF
jgi:hypothetical protein